MSIAANAMQIPTSIASNGCLTPLTKASDSHSHLSLLLKPVKFQLSSSYSSSIWHPSLFSRQRKERLLKVSIITAQQEENGPEFLEDDGKKFGADFEWEASGNEESFGAVEDVELSEEAKVYVGNFPYDVDSEQLAKLFGEAGVVEIAEVIYNRETDQSRGFGFVTMSTVEEAEKAVEMFHRYDINGRLLTVNKAAPRGSRPERSRSPRGVEPTYRIYAGNLPWDVDDSRLEQLFCEHGKVINARVVTDRETGRSRGFGFVTMSCESERNDAIANLDGQSLDGRTIRVNVADERPRRANF